jgi:hypothetical protein
MWLRKAHAGCAQWRTSPGQDFFEGWHDGYRALSDPVMHRRRIVLDKAARRVVIEDVLQMEDWHDVELFLHAHEKCAVSMSAAGAKLARGDRALDIRFPHAPGAQTQVLHGSESPIGGWISRAFDRKQPSPTLVWRARLKGHSVLRTEIDVLAPGA